MLGDDPGGDSKNLPQIPYFYRSFSCRPEDYIYDQTAHDFSIRS